MEKIEYDAKYFNPLHTLDCGQIFRFSEFGEGYMVISGDRAAYLHTDGKTTVAECDDGEYFYNFFNLARDYAEIIKKAESFSVPLLSRSCEKCSGLRLLNQQKEEMIYSFIISQNNNIPRIKGIISRICEGLGEKREFMGRQYYAFPTTDALASADVEFFRRAGCGYRDVFLFETSKKIKREGLGGLENLNTPDLKRALMEYKGVGAKVADCIALFGFSKRDSFPVDTWIEKIYREDFNGKLTDRNKICDYFTGLFKENSGYIQQYLFYGKRLNL